MLRATAIWGTGPGTPYYTNMYYNGSTSGEAVFAHSATVDLLTALQPHIVNDLAYTVLSEVAQIDPVSGDILATFVVPPVNGVCSHVGAPAAWHTQGLIRWRTGVYVGGREIRGRTFVPGVPASYMLDGNPSVSYLNNVLGVAQAHLANVDTVAAGGAAVWSPARGQSAAISTTSVWNRFAVLRSRRPL